MRYSWRTTLSILVCAFLAANSHAEGQNRPPSIKHEPVKVAVRGQPVTILANVTDDSGIVKSATLFYSTSKDAAPFRSPMKSSGTSLYYGTIPASVLGSVDSISYYIEALDHVDAAQETEWHTIEIKDSTAPVKTVEAGPAAIPVAPVQPAESGGPSALTVGAIAVGAAAVVGGAVLLANSGGDSSDDGDGGGTGGASAGSYVGNVTECSSLEGGSSSCNSHSFLISISDTGVVSSDSLREGVSMEGPLRGNEFALVAQLTGVSTGEVVYSGTVIDQRIVGSITGSSRSSAGLSVHSGTFSATKN